MSERKQVTVKKTQWFLVDVPLDEYLCMEEGNPAPLRKWLDDHEHQWAIPANNQDGEIEILP